MWKIFLIILLMGVGCESTQKINSNEKAKSNRSKRILPILIVYTEPTPDSNNVKAFEAFFKEKKIEIITKQEAVALTKDEFDRIIKDMKTQVASGNRSTYAIDQSLIPRYNSLTISLPELNNDQEKLLVRWKTKAMPEGKREVQENDSKWYSIDINRSQIGSVDKIIQYVGNLILESKLLK